MIKIGSLATFWSPEDPLSEITNITSNTYLDNYKPTEEIINSLYLEDDMVHLKREFQKLFNNSEIKINELENQFHKIWIEKNIYNEDTQNYWFNKDIEILKLIGQPYWNKEKLKEILNQVAIDYDYSYENGVKMYLGMPIIF